MAQPVEAPALRRAVAVSPPSVGGRASLGHVAGVDHALQGWAGLSAALGLGLAGAALLLATSWRRRRV